MEDRKVYYDKNYNRFFGVIKKYPRTYLITSLLGFYDTAKNGDTFRYSIPKNYLNQCVLVEKAENEYSEMCVSVLNNPIGYAVKGYSAFSTEPEINKNIFKWNEYQHKIAQYRYDKKNNFWKNLPNYDDFEDYDTNTLDDDN